MTRPIVLFVSLLACFGALVLFVAAGRVDTNALPLRADATAEPWVDLRTPQQVRPPRLKAHYDLAGEEVPIDDDDIRDRLDRELLTNTFYHSSTQHILKRKDKYFAVIEPILREEGVPEDMKYIAVAESAFRDFRSPAGAAGVWHFMEGTAKEYGLEVNDEVDERYHLEKATHAAARFLKDLKGRMGTWTLAAAAYNRGAGGVSSQLVSQRGTGYYDLNLNEETARYVFRIVSLKDICEDPTYYGFFLAPEDIYAPLSASDYRTVQVAQTIPNLGDFALAQNTTYRQLKYLNPWLREGKLTVKNNRYEIRVGN